MSSEDVKSLMALERETTHYRKNWQKTQDDLVKLYIII